VLATGYVSKLLRNGRVVGYLAKHYQELLFEFQKLTDAEGAAISRRIGDQAICHMPYNTLHRIKRIRPRLFASL
jgi:hypothetical protein